MAILHQAELDPSKIDMALAWLDAQPWGGSGPGELVGQYRFDDPDGEVGVEGLIVRRGSDVFHLPVTYRGAPLADGALITTMQHSVLGDRWVNHAASDPVAVGCFARALRGEQTQATLELHDGDKVEMREPTAVVTVKPGTGATADVNVDAIDVGGQTLTFARVLSDTTVPRGTATLLATWTDEHGTHRAVVAALG